MSALDVLPAWRLTYHGFADRWWHFGQLMKHLCDHRVMRKMNDDWAAPGVWKWKLGQLGVGFLDNARTTGVVCRWLVSSAALEI